MPEMRHIACPSCTGDNVPLAVVNGIEEYRCRACGLVYYGPCGCDTDHAAPAAKGENGHLTGDWEMSLVPASVEGAGDAAKYQGCS